MNSGVKFKMFTTGEWTDVDFFDDLVNGFQKLVVSLADRPIPKPHPSQPRQKLGKDFKHYGRRTSSQKRQKKFDYSEIYYLLNPVSKPYFARAVDEILKTEVPVNITPSKLEFAIRGLAAKDTWKAQAKALAIDQKHLPPIDQISKIPDRIRNPKKRILLDSYICYTTKNAIYYSNLIMATSTDSQLFEDNFTITSIDNSKYDRVARLGCAGSNNECVMTLDINTELFPCSLNDNLVCVLASTLSLDGTKDDKGWRDVGRAGGETTLADMYDYVCHGKLYKFEDGDDGVM